MLSSLMCMLYRHMHGHTKPYVCNETHPRFTYMHNESLTTVTDRKWYIAVNMHCGLYLAMYLLAMMLVRVEAGHTVLPERLAMMLVRVEAGHTVLPETGLAMMLVRVEAGHTVLPGGWL